MKARAHRRRQRVLLAVTLMAGLLSACGGGGYSIPAAGNSNSAALNLVCATACIASNTVATDKLRWSYVLVNDGKNPRAFAAFGTGSDPRVNVEIKGDDQIQLMTSQGAQPFYIPAPDSLGAAIAQALLEVFTLPLAGASPYESDLNATEAAQPVQFQIIRGSTVYSSTATLPPSFSFTAPANNAVLPISTRTLQVQLTSAVPASFAPLTMSCTDSNGNTAATSNGGLLITSGPVATGSGGTSYTLDMGAFLDGLNFTTTFPRGVLSKCSLAIQATTNGSGQVAKGFASTVVVAQQIRTVNLTLQ